MKRFIEVNIIIVECMPELKNVKYNDKVSAKTDFLLRFFRSIRR